MSERRERVKEVYHGALTRDPKERVSFVHSTCEGDDALRLEIEELLRYGAEAESKSFLNAPAIPEPGYSDLATPGTRLGPYEIVSLLGRGGMGQVFEARDSRLGRLVALKLLGTELSGHLEARLRFLREARSAAALSHPNIATIFDAGEVQEQLYLAMELIDGQSLRSLLPPGGLTIPETLDYARQLGSALEHAHSRGILHRDIKPENVMVEKSGAVKLVDFGIAKSMPTTDTSAETEVTRPGTFVGTLQYAPPEALVGSTATRESDIYSFGIMLFEMLCGHTPFQGLAAGALAEAIIRGDRPSIRSINATVPEGLANIIERSIAREPENRFSSATEMLAAFQSALDGGGTNESATPATKQLPLLAILEFTNLSREPSLDWLSTGIVETLDADMRKLGTLQVVSRSRSQQVLRGLGVNVEDPAGLNALGNRLGVKWIVSGSFQRSGPQIRVTPRIFKFPGGDPVTAQKVDGSWENLFEVQDRVVQVLIEAFELERAPGSSAPESPSLDAYEHYATGRQFMNQMGRDSLGRAIEHFEKAVALDPNYALAYSGLGSSHGLKFIHTSNPEALKLAVQFLERAIKLDPELGEPYPFLCYAYNRLGDNKKSVAAGRMGIRLQPDLAQSHYFYAGVMMTGVEQGQGNHQASIDSVSEAMRLDPMRGPQWLVAGSVALDIGSYSAAVTFFDHALQLERVPNVPFKFVGALSMMGFTQMRQGAWEDARQSHLQSLEVLRDTEHVYRDVFITLSACGLGEIELRSGTAEAALTRFRHASRIVKEEPRMVGNIRLGIRAQAGMASSYAALGERERAEQLLAEAMSRLPSVELGSWVWDTLLFRLHYSIASAQLRLGLEKEALASLGTALDTGFADPFLLTADSEWEPIRRVPEFLRLVERVRLIPPVTIDFNRFPPLSALPSASGTLRPS